MQPDVIVVGGAVAGAATANALAQHGVNVLVLEKVSREVHSTRGDLLHPPTLRILDRWGVLAALHSDGVVPITEIAVSDARRGLVARYPVDAVDDTAAGRTIALPHDRIEAVLLQVAERQPTVALRRGVATAVERDHTGRAVGVRFRPHASAEEESLRARLVVGCDGSQSLVRRSLEVAVQVEHYNHEEVIIGGHGTPELPNALHWYVDQIGGVGVVARPRGECRLLVALMHGQRGDLLRQPDPALYDYLVERFPSLAPLRFSKSQAHVYRLSRHWAERFWQPGAALVGDAAHGTHPTGASGMSLAIASAARLAELVGPTLSAGASDAAVDEALQTYDAERRPAAMAALEATHAQALRLWEHGLYADAEAYAKAVDPRGGYGVGGAGWGQNPGALASAP